MARRMRLVFPGVALHLVQRGVDRTACFHAEADYLVYLSQLRHLSAQHGCAIHAYCLMTNHVHLLLTPNTAQSCTALMRDLGQRYVPYFNSRHGRTGTLWEGRYRSCIAQSARYVLTRLIAARIGIRTLHSIRNLSPWRPKSKHGTAPIWGYSSSSWTNHC